MRLAVRILLGLMIGAYAGAPSPSTAATITGVTFVKNAGNTADFFDNAGNIISAAQSTPTITASTANTLDTRFATVVSADRDGGGGGPGAFTQNFTGNFSITFSVTANPGWDWFLTLDVLRIGAQTIISDGNGLALVTLGALTGSETGAGSITSGSMNLAALPPLSNVFAEGTSTDAPFNQATNAVLQGIGTGAAQIVIFTFIFNASATTVDLPGGGTPAGDEAALRMGHDSALDSFTADDYPGTGLRNLATDGIWVLSPAGRDARAGNRGAARARALPGSASIAARAGAEPAPQRPFQSGARRSMKASMPSPASSASMLRAITSAA